MFFRLMFFQISIGGEHSGYSVKDTYHLDTAWHKAFWKRQDFKKAYKRVEQLVTAAYVTTQSNLLQLMILMIHLFTRCCFCSS